MLTSRRVIFYGRRRRAETVGMQFSEGQTDLAGLRVQASRQLRVISLGSSSVQVGELVVAIGTSLGLSGIVTTRCFG